VLSNTPIAECVCLPSERKNRIWHTPLAAPLATHRYVLKRWLGLQHRAGRLLRRNVPARVPNKSNTPEIRSFAFFWTHASEGGRFNDPFKKGSKRYGKKIQVKIIAKAR
jgi:hypothetical protein